MNEHAGNLGILCNLESNDLVLVVSAVVLAWLLASAIRWVLRHAAESAPLRLRLPILRVIPLLRLGVGIAALTIRGKEALRTMNLRFAQAPYAEVSRD